MISEDFVKKIKCGDYFTGDDICFLLTTDDEDFLKYFSDQCLSVRTRNYGNAVFLRGIIEITNYCRNNCLYCGLRRSNNNVKRYRMTAESVFDACRIGYTLGIRTFVLQGGEDPFFGDDFLCEIVSEIKKMFPDCAVTLSLGERSCNSYRRLYEAGADRYLLRHETADRNHYGKLHPADMSFENRFRCLRDLKDIGFQTGCGFMVGSPFQTYDSIAMDINFIMDFNPHMCGIGPFISHGATPFAEMKNGSIKQTLRLLELIRIVIPDILLPATTALGVSGMSGLIEGVASGANVIMPNITPLNYIKLYEIYEGKGDLPGYSLHEKVLLEKRLLEKGYVIDYGRGDTRRKKCTI